MEEIDKYHKMLQNLKDNFSHYDEVDNTTQENSWKINDLVICIVFMTSVNVDPVIKIEEMISEIQQTAKHKPSISVTEAKIEAKPIIENKEKELVNKTLSKLDSIFEKNVPIIIEDEDEEIEEIKEEIKKEEKPSIMKFGSFK